MSTGDPFDIAAEAQDEEAKRKRQAAEVEQEAEDWLWLMGSARGRRIVWRLLERAGMYRTSFTGQDSLTNFNEGQRNIGLAIQAKVNRHALQHASKMVRENT